jgi:GNAT superfamily N-acetyltransferase
MTTLTSVPVPAAIEATGITFRMWRGPEDVPGMAVANNALRDRCGVLERVDVGGMRNHYANLVNSDPADDVLVIERDGVIAGYARIEWHDLADGDRIYDGTLLVSPAIWGHGVAATAIRWIEARAAVMAAAHPTDRVEHLGHYQFDEDAEAITALAELGYEPVRWDAELLRPDLEDIGPEVLPDGYVIRTPEEDELPRVHEMYVAAFHEHWGQTVDDDQRIEEWIGDPRFRRHLQVVVFHGAEPAAGVSNKLHEQPDGSVSGLLDGVATHPDHRRRGLARAAVNHSLRLLRDEGATSAYLGVDTQNHNRAMELYESCGFRLATSGTQYRKPVRRETGG